MAARPPHQCPNVFLFKTLKFYIYPPIAQIYASYLIHKPCSSFIQTNPPTAAFFFLYSDKPLSVIFLAMRENQPQIWCRHYEGDVDVVDELYLNFLYCNVSVCFPFCWVWLNFALTKYQWNCVALFVGFVFLCDLFVGFSLFHLILWVCLSVFVCIWIVWVSFGFFYVGMYSSVNCA